MQISRNVNYTAGFIYSATGTVNITGISLSTTVDTNTGLNSVAGIVGTIGSSSTMTF